MRPTSAICSPSRRDRATGRVWDDGSWVRKLAS
jgi:hypothetical protein